MPDEDYVEGVLALVEQVPAGRVTTYGLIAGLLHDSLGRGGPRTVAAVMAHSGDLVAWWRVVRADGTLPAALADRARPEYLTEGTPLRPGGLVDLDQALWMPASVHRSDP